MINGTIAPPIIPVIKMPAKEPWCSFTEFKASENMIGYITDAKNPVKGNAIREIDAGPYKANEKDIIASIVKDINMIRLSHILRRNNPITPPAVINPQK
ncbi:MAG: hypothetical protein NVSMB45_13980 [Ginsengibacter sp.]